MFIFFRKNKNFRKINFLILIFCFLLILVAKEVDSRTEKIFPNYDDNISKSKPVYRNWILDEINRLMGKSSSPQPSQGDRTRSIQGSRNTQPENSNAGTILCATGYYFDLENWQCKKCHTIGASNYHYDGKSCEIRACYEDQGYHLVSANNRCEKCEIEGALETVYRNNACQAESCDEEMQYYLYQGQCYKCSLAEGALTMKYDNTCMPASCNNEIGYHLSQNKCAKCALEGTTDLYYQDGCKARACNNEIGYHLVNHKCEKCSITGATDLYYQKGCKVRACNNIEGYYVNTKKEDYSKCYSCELAPGATSMKYENGGCEPKTCNNAEGFYLKSEMCVQCDVPGALTVKYENQTCKAKTCDESQGYFLNTKTSLCERCTPESLDQEGVLTTEYVGNECKVSTCKVDDGYFLNINTGACEKCTPESLAQEGVLSVEYINNNCGPATCKESEGYHLDKGQCKLCKVTGATQVIYQDNKCQAQTCNNGSDYYMDYDNNECKFCKMPPGGSAMGYNSDKDRCEAACDSLKGYEQDGEGSCRCSATNGYESDGSGACQKICGNGKLDAGEECDPSIHSMCCGDNCQFACQADSYNNTSLSMKDNSGNTLSTVSLLTGESINVTLPECRIASNISFDVSGKAATKGLGIVFVTDVSGSMGIDGMKAVRDSLTKSIDILYEEVDENEADIYVGLVDFDDDINFFSVNKLDMAFKDSLILEVGTYARDGYTYTEEALDKARKLFNGNIDDVSLMSLPVKIIILLSDGNPTNNNRRGNHNPTNTTLNSIFSNNIELHTVTYKNNSLSSKMCNWINSCKWYNSKCVQNGDHTKTCSYAHIGNISNIETVFNNITKDIAQKPQQETITGGRLDGDKLIVDMESGFCSSGNNTKEIQLGFDGGGYLNLSNGQFHYCPKCVTIKKKDTSQKHLR